ncbi:enamine deaminase RidA (YjgF/YER057c/UK114 family) [Mesorhizobium robiniae]|uniref:Enamine deaminase RidA (YjgF/YER057c/UK114 family) n=2 Tax=Mesorhizobium robiniae TaxID=559315 RepID=A0ABV2GLK9_9HYPH
MPVPLAFLVGLAEEFDPASLVFATLIKCRASGPAYNGFALSIHPFWPMAERLIFSSLSPEEYARKSMRKLISTGSPFEKAAGYSRAVVQGDWCFVSGTTGYDYATMSMPETVEAQTRNCLATIAKALQDGGFEMADVVRAHYYITDAAFVDIVFPILGEAFGDIRPAATMIICQLNKPEMKIEIEVTALRRTT